MSARALLLGFVLDGVSAKTCHHFVKHQPVVSEVNYMEDFFGILGVVVLHVVSMVMYVGVLAVLRACDPDFGPRDALPHYCEKYIPEAWSPVQVLVGVSLLWELAVLSWLPELFLFALFTWMGRRQSTDKR